MIVKPTQAHTIPPITQIAAGEVVEFIYDPVNDLGLGQSAINPSAELFNAATRESITDDMLDEDSPSIVANLVSIRVAGIERGVSYELRISFEHEPPRVTGEKTTKIMIIEGV